jgi:hypothetical protein
MLGVDPDLADAHATRGIAAMFFRWDWEQAEAELTRALALNDRCMTAHAYQSLFLFCRGRTLEGLDAARRAERLDPMSLLAMSCVAWGLLHSGDLEAAEAQLHRMLGVDPDFPDALMLLGRIAEARQNLDLAISYNRRWFPRAGMQEADVDALLAAHRDGGWPAYWRAYLALLESGGGAPCQTVSVFAAQIHATLGDQERALEALDRAFEVRAPMLAFARVDMQLATLRGHPRFEEMLKRLRLND